MSSKDTYTVRFSIGMIMTHFLDEPYFKPEILSKVSDIKSNEYYINMMIAWFFAVALAKQYKTTIPYIENRDLIPFSQNIQKAIESYRISNDKKVYLKNLKYLISKSKIAKNR